MALDEWGLERNPQGYTNEGRNPPPGTTPEQYRAMLAAESARDIAAVRRTDNPKLWTGQQLRILGNSRTNRADIFRRIHNIERIL
jgi:hypothetical protein